MEFITSSHGGVKLINDGFAYTKKAENTNRIRLVVTTSLLHDDLHITVLHNHPADVAAVKALKVKTTMRDWVQDTVDTVIMMNWTRSYKIDEKKTVVKTLEGLGHIVRF